MEKSGAPPPAGPALQEEWMMLWNKKKAEDETIAAESRSTRLLEGIAARLPRRGEWKGFWKSLWEKKPWKSWSRKRIVLTALAGVLVIVSCVGGYALFFAQEERIAVTGTTTYGALNEAIQGSGTTTPADSVTYEITGKVLEWNVEAGQEVKAGDLLYVLDSSDAEDEMLEYEVDLEDLYEQRAEIQESIANQQVTAPFSGRIEDIQVEAGDDAQTGMTLATLVDDSAMKATLYFSYAYEDEMYVGMPVTLSVPDQMLTLDGTVTDIRYVDYTTTEGMKCFAVTVEAENPGSLTEGVTATCWAQSADGTELYAVSDAQLEFAHSATLTAETSGEVTAVNPVDYQRVSAGETLFVIDASGYETQLETVEKQIDNYEKNIADLQESIDTEYTRYSDIDGTVVTAEYATNRMTGEDVGSVVVYNQESMEISVNVDELDVDYLEVGMPVTVYRSTSSDVVYYQGELTYLSLEATSGSSGVSTFAATITITPLEGEEFDLSSGVTVYYSIDTGDGEGTGETVLAPLSALCTYDDGYYLLVQADSRPDNAIDPEEVGGSVTDYPEGYYAVPVEAGDYNEQYVQILSGAEQDATVFLRYQNAAPSGGDTTSDSGEEEGMSGFPGGEMLDFGDMGGMPDFGGSGGSMPSFGGGGGGMPSGMGMR